VGKKWGGKTNGGGMKEKERGWKKRKGNDRKGKGMKEKEREWKH